MTEKNDVYNSKTYNNAYNNNAYSNPYNNEGYNNEGYNNEAYNVDVCRNEEITRLGALPVMPAVLSENKNLPLADFRGLADILKSKELPDFDKDLDSIENAGVLQMLGHADEFACQIRNAWRLGEDAEIKDRQKAGTFKRAFVCGMGGSGIGGSLAEKYACEHSEIDVTAVKGYDLPPNIDEDSLVIAVSHSGNTAETLHCYNYAKSRNAVCAVVAGGGRLFADAQSSGDTAVKIPTELLPRESSAYLTIPVFWLLAHYGLWEMRTAELLEILEAVNSIIFTCNLFVPSAENPAKRLAEKICRKTPVILGVCGYMESAARKWKTMLNENAKIPVLANSLPEFFHNEIEAVNPSCQILILRSLAENPNLKKQIAAMQRVLADKGIDCEMVWVMGGSTLAKAMSMMLLGDYCSLYASHLLGRDCKTIPTVNALKKLV